MCWDILVLEAKAVQFYGTEVFHFAVTNDTQQINYYCLVIKEPLSRSPTQLGTALHYIVDRITD